MCATRHLASCTGGARFAVGFGLFGFFMGMSRTLTSVSSSKLLPLELTGHNVTFFDDPPPFPELPRAATDGRLRLQSTQASRRTALFMSSRLCGLLHRPNVFQDAPKIRLRRKAHGSISVQEGQPGFLLIALRIPRVSYPASASVPTRDAKPPRQRSARAVADGRHKQRRWPGESVKESDRLLLHQSVLQAGPVLGAVFTLRRAAGACGRSETAARCETSPRCQSSL